MNEFKEIARLVRYYILTSTTKAGSGHPSSSLSATDLMVALMFSRFRLGLDHLIFSKGHAAPLLYSLYTAAGLVKPEELYTLRKFGSPIEGHPTPAFKYADVATGSLGQGLSVGLGMALNAKFLDKTEAQTYVLLGDSEMTEGSIWEALAVAARYRLDNLVAIADVNRLGQANETLHGHDLNAYAGKAAAFGWAVKIIDGHNFSQINSAYDQIGREKSRPLLILAKTIKGKGVSFIEDQPGWHGKPLNEDELRAALDELGPVNKESTWTIKSAS